MSIRQSKYSAEEALQLGKRLYEEEVHPFVKDEDFGKFVSIDLNSGEWEMDSDRMMPSERLRQRVPEAQILATRVGFGYVVRIRTPLWRRLPAGEA